MGWTGLQSTCCTNPNMPWFLKPLNKTITDNIELRVCSNEGLLDEDTPSTQYYAIKLLNIH